jgi:hypothetical protein
MNIESLITVTYADRKRLEPHLCGAHTLHRWYATDPSEDDLFKAWKIESGRVNPRCRLLGRIYHRALMANKRKTLKKYGCPCP